jgi:hypothetical protein
VVFPIPMRTLSPVISFQMSHFSLSVQLIPGMETFSYISRPDASSQIFCVTSDVTFDIIQNITLLLETLYITTVLKLFYDIV